MARIVSPSSDRWMAWSATSATTGSVSGFAAPLSMPTAPGGVGLICAREPAGTPAQAIAAKAARTRNPTPGIRMVPSNPNAPGPHHASGMIPPQEARVSIVENRAAGIAFPSARLRAARTAGQIDAMIISLQRARPRRLPAHTIMPRIPTSATSEVSDQRGQRPATPAAGHQRMAIFATIDVSGWRLRGRPGAAPGRACDGATA